MKQCISLIVFNTGLSLFGQGTTPKPKASDYPVHARIGGADLGVEYMVRSFGEDQMLLANDYLIVEVAVYPDQLTVFETDARRFTLRINGKKVHKVALPEGPARNPVSGFLFFPYRGKLSKLKSVELLVDYGSGPVLLRLK